MKWNFIATHLNQNFSLADIIDGETFSSQNFGPVAQALSHNIFNSSELADLAQTLPLSLSLWAA